MAVLVWGLLACLISAPAALGRGSDGTRSSLHESSDHEARDSGIRPDDPPGTLVDIGGRHLHLNCIGAGGPTVVVEAGGGQFSLDWAQVAGRVAEFTEICTYDRAGTGWSDPGPLPRTSGRIVDDLRSLLVAGGVAGPVILVGHSFGALNARLFAARYSDDVVGLILVDPSHEDLFDPRPPQYWERDIRRLQRLRQEIRAGEAILPGSGSDPSVRLRLRASAVEAAYSVMTNYESSAEAVRREAKLDDELATIVLTALEYRFPPELEDRVGKLRSAWIEAHQRLATSIHRARHLLVPAVGHDIHAEKPDAVVEAIHWLWADERSRRHTTVADSEPDLRPCPERSADGRARCGSLEVPEDRSDVTGRSIALSIVVFPALTEDRAPDPVFAIAGGPGGATTAIPPELFSEIRRRRDVVLVDLRGTGGSAPLDCAMPGSITDLSGYYSEMLPIDVVRECRGELERRADLGLYTTHLAVDDLNDVRRWLGYDKINLYAASYGTRAAQTFLRRHPDAVRSLVLRVPIGLDERSPTFRPRDGQRGFELVFAACERDSECAGAYPDLADKLDRVIQRLRHERAMVVVEPPDGDAPTQTIPLSAGVFVEQLRTFLYSPDSVVKLPWVIEQAHRGDFMPFIRETLPTAARMMRRDFSVGTFLSVTCSEEVPFIDLAEARGLADGTYLGEYRLGQQLRACENWPRGRVPPGHSAALQSDVPVLLLSGFYDPVAPPRWAERIAQGFPESLHVVVPEGHHSFSGLADQDCIDRLVHEFIDRGEATGLDASCVQRMRRQEPFFVPKRGG